MVAWGSGANAEWDSRTFPPEPGGNEEVSGVDEGWEGRMSQPNPNSYMLWAVGLGERCVWVKGVCG